MRRRVLFVCRERRDERLLFFCDTLVTVVSSLVFLFGAARFLFFKAIDCDFDCTRLYYSKKSSDNKNVGKRKASLNVNQLGRDPS